MADIDRMAIVTGTSSGIGAATAELLVDGGWTVIGMSRRRARIDSTAYRHVEADFADVGRLVEITSLEIAPVLSDTRWQRVGLVNNAADGGDAEFLDTLDPAVFQKMLAINTVAPVWLMGFVARVAPAAATLRIVNVSSGAAVRAFPGSASYSASKAALRLAGMTLGAELASPDRPGGPRHNAAVVSYAPGVVDTEMQLAMRSANKPWTKMFVDLHESGMLAPPEAPARDIVQMLESQNLEPFSERRLGDT